jgi:dinuclear metal center YbgI/SA1388 family protein
MHRDDLTKLLDGWLEPAKFSDVAENGLQVEGRASVAKVVCGVSANLALIDRAIADGADAIFVHHGIVWGGGIKRISGWLGERVRRLVGAGITLYAYHLPLDAHPTLGNNAGLADALGVSSSRRPFGAYKGQLIGVAGDVDTTFAALVARTTANVGAPVAVFGDPAKRVRSVGLCTGGAPELLHDAVAAGLDVYVTGEATEWVQSVAEETGTCFIAAGHHASERFGATRVAAALREAGLDASFVDVANPV